MSFEKGTIGLTIFRLAEKLPGNALEMFATMAADKLEYIKDEVQVGFTSGRDLLECNINEDTGKYGGYIYLNMRIAQRKIPSVRLNAECRKAEMEYMSTNKQDFVTNKVRRQIRTDIAEWMRTCAQVDIKGIPFVVNGDMIYLGTTSQQNIDLFLSLFRGVFKLEPAQLAMGTMRNIHFNSDAEFCPVRFSENKAESSPARDFLTWLWFFSEDGGKTAGGGKVKVGSEPCDLLIEGPLAFASSEEAEGSRETVVRKDRPTRSAEAKIALAVGKKLKKAKLTLTRGEEIWACTFDADRFSFSGLKLPDAGELLDGASWFAERINSIDIFQAAIQEFFIAFFKISTSLDWENEQDRILSWSKHKGY